MMILMAWYVINASLLRYPPEPQDDAGCAIPEARSAPRGDPPPTL